MSDQEVLEDFLARHPAMGGWQDVWKGVPLEISAHLCPELPPRALVASVRALVLHGQEVLLVQDTAPHLTVGGRPEPGETLEAALLREVEEESGWRAPVLGVIGFTHAHHLVHKRPNWGRPAPDFLDVIYAVEAQNFDSQRLEPGLPPCRMVPLLEVDGHGIEAISRTFLAAALRRRATPRT